MSQGFTTESPVSDATTSIAGKIKLASQSSQETGTAADEAVMPNVQQYHQSAAKCWLIGAHSGGTPVIAASYGVSSLTDSGTGLVTVNLSVTFSSANWAALWTGGLNLAGTFWCNAAQSSRTTTTTVAQMTGLDNNVYDVQLFTMAGFGDLS